jgi:hypothetical protein
MPFSESSLEQALKALGELLDSRGLEYRLAAVGGGAMLLLGLLDRPTNDLDVVTQDDESGAAVSADPLASPLREAITDVARAFDLPEDWLNPGPAALLELGLPPGFDDRAHVRRYGALEIRLADRVDQIHFKLYASVDQGPESKHFADLEALEPTREELLAAARWARTHDPSDGFRAGLEAALEALGVSATDEQL